MTKKKKETKKELTHKKKEVSVFSKHDEIKLFREDIFYMDFRFSKPNEEIIKFCLKDLTFQKAGPHIVIPSLFYKLSEIIEFFREKKEETKEELYIKFKKTAYEFTRNALQALRFFKKNDPDEYIFPWFTKLMYDNKKDLFEIHFNPKMYLFFFSIKENLNPEVFKIDMPTKDEVLPFLKIKSLKKNNPSLNSSAIKKEKPIKQLNLPIGSKKD